MSAQTFMPLWQWFAHQMRELRRIPATQGPGLLMGCPIWGKTYIDRFGDYCLPTIVSPKNLAALSGNCRMVIFTDAEGWFRLDTMLRPLRMHWGIDYQLITLPPEVMELTGKHTYPVLGACQNLLLQMAGWWGMSFHALHPDHVCNEVFYPNLIRLAEHHDAIAHIGVCIDIRTAMRDLEAFRQADDELTIPGLELGDIGRRHLHRLMQVYLMNDGRLPDRMPHSHYLLWQGPDRMRIHTPHMNAAYLSARLCEMIQVPIGADLLKTMDTRLPVLIPDAKFHVPQIKDDMVCLELSDGSRQYYPGYVAADDFCRAAWKNVHFSERFKPYFNAACDVPTKAPADHDRIRPMALDAIAAQQAAVMDMLAASKARLAIEEHEKRGSLWQPPKSKQPVPQLEPVA